MANGQVMELFANNFDFQSPHHCIFALQNKISLILYVFLETLRHNFPNGIK